MSALRAAVIGVHGIGKFHAEWYAHHGCEVVAFAGSSAETTAEAEAVLKRNFGFSGKRYWDVEQLLDEAKPDLASVCSPARLHFEHARRCLDRGVHVLCEKPLVWDDPPNASALMGQCDELFGLARQRQRILAVNTQYVSMLDAFLKLAGDRCQRRFPSEMGWVMEIRDRGWAPLFLLTDTVSHPLSVLINLAGGGPVALRDVRVGWTDKGVSARFDAVHGAGTCRCDWRVDQVPGPQMDRSLTIDGFEAALGYHKYETGMVTTTLSAGDRTVEIPDMMSESIRRFIAGCRGEGPPLVDPDSSRLNLQLQLDLTPAPDVPPHV